MYEKYFNKLKEECLIRNRKEETLRTYTNHIKKFLNWTGNKQPEELTLEDARNYIYELRVDKNRSTQHCNGINSALKFFYKHVLHKPWDSEAVPRMVNDVRLPEVTTLENIEKMIDTAREVRNKAIIALLYSSGLRVGELCRLAPGDIYMSTMQVHVRYEKNHQDHWTILSQKTLDLLTEYWRSNPLKREKLFVTLNAPYRPLKKSGVECMVRKIGREAGIGRVYPHLLRHSFASHMVEQGVPLEHIQSMMGHRDPYSTHRYIHVSNKALMGITSPLDHPHEKKRGREKKNG